MNQNAFNLRLSGDKAADVETVAQVLIATNELFREVSRELCGDPDAVVLKIGSFRLICDGCERVKTEESSGWIKHEGLDYCPSCQAGVEA